jgi:hypothetical protein
MDAYVNEDDIDSFEKGDILLTIIFIILDILILFIFFILLKSKDENIKLLKLRMFTLFSIDIIVRILIIKTYYHPNDFFKEVFFSVMPACQFHLILSFLNQLLNDNQSKNENNSTEKVNSYELSILFFLYTFSYDKFSYSFSKHLCFLQSFINLGLIFKLYEYLKNILLEIIENIEHKDYQRKTIYLFIKNLPYSSLAFFIIFYLLKIFSIFVENSLYLIYIRIILIIVKETSKYFVFFILGAILFVSDKNCERKIIAEENININKN